MNNDIYALYYELNHLLEDICSFLNNDIVHGQLSGESKNIADTLIKRSKISILEIAKISPDGDSVRYVDMKGPNSPQHTPEIVEIYSDITNEQQDAASISDANFVEYINVAAQMIPFANQTGYLERKEKIKILIFLEQKRKLYAAIHHSWMLLYNTEKDLKPFDSLDLTDSYACHIEKKEMCFDLNVDSGAKIYQFVAATKNDAMQWVCAINNVKFNVKLPAIIAVTQEVDDHEIYDQLVDDFDDALAATTTQDDDTYDIIDDAQNTKAPTEPKSWNPRLRPVPKLPPNTQTNIEEDYDLISSTSEEIYDVLSSSAAVAATAVVMIDNGQNTLEEQDCIYDVLSSHNANDFGSTEQIYDVLTVPKPPPPPDDAMAPRLSYLHRLSPPRKPPPMALFRSIHDDYNNENKPTIKPKLFKNKKRSANNNK